MDRHPTLLDRAASVLVVVDMQEVLLNVMHARDAVAANVLLLCRCAAVLRVPVLFTTQNAARMGAVLPALTHAVHAPHPPLDKMAFSCAESPAFVSALADLSRRQVVLCGLETHICVSQTAHDLRYAGYQAHVVADAVSSRTGEKHKLGMERIRDAGIAPAAAEAVIYEWLREAGTAEFKEILPLVK